MRTLNLPEPLEASLDQYSKTVHQEPEAVILEAIAQYLTVRAAQKQGIEEALAEDDTKGIHYSQETMDDWVSDLQQGKTADPTPDV